MGARSSHVARVVWSGCAILSVSTLLLAQPAPDNTKVNTRDRAASQPTADQQKNGRTDVTITRDIRRAIMEDKSLSTYAHNIKVITRHGEVTLKGPVRSDEEKKTVEAKAAAVAGAAHVKSEVAVKSATPKHTKQ